jgi:hypothetical protein
VYSLLYLIAVLASLFFLLVFGSLAGGVLLSPAGPAGALLGATAGAVVGICVWFKVVGYFVDLEDAYLSDTRAAAAQEPPRPADVLPALPARDVRRGNHIMVCGIVTFVSALFSAPGVGLLVGAAGVSIAVAGFVISLTAAELPSEEGTLRRVKLLLARPRP